MIPEQAVALAVGDGVTLEARLGLPPSPRAGVVICHPHPLYGGDMDNPVVVRAAEVCGAAGLATLRFNFRGVGGSTGSHGGGPAEERDVEAAMARMTQHAERVALAGYSFGAAVAGAVAARRPEVAGLALVAPPIAGAAGGPALAEGGALRTLSRAGAPVLVVAGDADEYCPRADLERLRAAVPGVEVRIIEGADHFFLGRLFPLGEALGAWARRLAGSGPASRAGAGPAWRCPPTG